MQATSFENTPQVFNQHLVKETLLTFCKQPVSMQLLKHFTQILHVLLDSGTKHKDVIHVCSYEMGIL